MDWARSRQCAAALAAVLASGLSQAAEQVFCGMGPPPGSPDSVAYERLQDRQRAALGHVLVCDDTLRQFDYLNGAQPLSKVTQRLVFTPIPLESTPFAAFELVGGTADHFGDKGAESLHRTFRSPEGRVIDLWEWDMSVSGGQVFPRADLQTERVNALPAQLTVLQTPSGKAVSILLWTEGRRLYQLSVDANVRTKQLRPSLAELAVSLPRS